MLQGIAGRELDRLSVQARMFEPFTRQLFQEAGLRPGMRVLDAGCGSGDVALLAGEIVGPTGVVVGIDRAAAAIARAKARAESQRMSNVQFVEGDPTLIRLDEGFDAIVGRLILMYYADPIVMHCENSWCNFDRVGSLSFRNSKRVAASLIRPHRHTNVARIGSSAHYS